MTELLKTLETTAEMDELSTAAKLFKERIGKINPALRPSTLTRHYAQWDGQFDRPRSFTGDFDERGFVLVDRYTRAQGEWPHCVTLSGTCLVLLTDGRLAELERSGSGSYNDEEWTATLRFVSPEEAVTRYGLEACMEKL